MTADFFSIVDPIQTLIFKTLQFHNPCRSCINSIKQQKLALPISPTQDSCNGRQLLAKTSVPTESKAIPDVMTSPAASGRHLSKFVKRPKMPHPTALFAFSLMQCKRRLQISRAKNIGNVFESSGVSFRTPQPYGGLLVVLHSFVRHEQMQQLFENEYRHCSAWTV